MKYFKPMIASLFAVSMLALVGCGNLADCICDSSCKPVSGCSRCCPPKPCNQQPANKAKAVVKPQEEQKGCCPTKRCCPPKPCNSNSK